jgi:hypothetical protein
MRWFPGASEKCASGYFAMRRLRATAVQHEDNFI